MEFTSASANKYLRRLQDEKDRLLRTEQEVSTYVLAEGEAAEPPAYDYGAVREKVAQIDGQARAIRHALHRFNMKTVLPERGITIDEALILLAQLSWRKERLNGLASLSIAASSGGDSAMRQCANPLAIGARLRRQSGWESFCSQPFFELSVARLPRSSR